MSYIEVSDIIGKGVINDILSIGENSGFKGYWERAINGDTWNKRN